MKIVHAADLHLDSPLRGLPAYEGAPLAEVRSATRRALSGLVDLCFEQRASLLLLAGDLYDGDFRDYSTALFLVEQLSRLREIDCKIVWIRGNHDAENQITRHLRLPEGAFELSTQSPETLVFEGLGVAVHGQGYATRDLTEKLALAYPPAHAGLFNIGLLHTALEGREGHAPYAPCSAAELTARGYDYWALGHVHQREVVKADVPIVFPGNLQGRHARESGEKGATVLSVDDGKLVDFTHYGVDVVRWVHEKIDARDLGSFGDVLDAANLALERASQQADGRLVACRVSLLGQSPAHAELVARRDELEAELRRSSIEGGFYIERVEHKTKGALLLDELSARGDAVAELLGRAELTLADDEECQRLQRELLGPLGTLPAELLEGDEDFREILGEARQLLEGRLLGGEALD